MAKVAEMADLPPSPGEQIPCPNCSGELQNKGKRTTCSQCKFVLWHEAFGKLLGAKDIEALLKYPLKKPIFLERNRAGAPVFTGFDF
ncbi:hypothetical protein [Pseudomonas cannabina]|uniref:hypothetical protein n=1 Tax=Pseudomonas cannabina TaxID=86840 RepID=UPI001113608C|nr:hypothetical protein [Pseudomonas cannabina]